MHSKTSRFTPAHALIPRRPLAAAILVLALGCGSAAPRPQSPGAGSGAPGLAGAASPEAGAATEPEADRAASETEGAAQPAPPIDCTRRPSEYGPLALDPDTYARRHGADSQNLASLVATKEQPVEVCLVAGEQAFLLAATCADGSYPFSSPDDVRLARTGSVGPGGRCGSIIDHYEVPCPERTYEVYMDMYFCLEGTPLP